ncbi:perlucin [Elysia marginata]|uniref:Perlucin n=1 Tax=Elysia marginata TaxID=1093978 RepID=A0AAV4FHT3_9GAST|nr:perlucin [Elysia marginata]
MFIKDQLASQNPGSKFWIGLNDQVMESKLVWLDEENEAVYKNMDPSQTRNERRVRGCVAAIVPGPNNQLQWKEENCDQAHHYICQGETELVRQCKGPKYSIKCSLDCSPHCDGADKSCARSDGKCLQGCEPGYQGDQCRQG